MEHAWASSTNNLYYQLMFTKYLTFFYMVQFVCLFIYNMKYEISLELLGLYTLAPGWKTFTFILALRWLDWIFLRGYLRRLSFNYVGMSKDTGKRLPQLYYITMKIFLWFGFYCYRSRHGNIMTPLRFLFIFLFLSTRSFLKKSLEGVCSCHKWLHYGKVSTNSMRAFSKYFDTQF